MSSITYHLVPSAGETGQLDEPDGVGGEREQALPRLHAGAHHVHDPIQVPNDADDNEEHKLMDSAYMAVSMMIMTMISILTVWDRLALHWQRLGSS